MCVVLTESGAVVPQCLAEEAVEFPHVAQPGTRPAVSCDACLDLRPKLWDELRLLREVVDHMGEVLKSITASVSYLYET